MKSTLLPTASPSDTVLSVQEFSSGYWSVVTEMETRCSCCSHGTIAVVLGDVLETVDEEGDVLEIVGTLVGAVVGKLLG